MKAEEILKTKLSAHWCTFIYAHPITGDKRLKDWIIEAMEAYHQEKVKGSADWKTIENDFKEWDAAGGFKASERDIIDWFKDNLPVGQDKEVVMPSDEEIEKEFPTDRETILKNEYSIDLYSVQRNNKLKQEGAKWMRDQLKPVDLREDLIKYEQWKEDTSLQITRYSYERIIDEYLKTR